MKMKYLLLTVLLVGTLFTAGCMSAGYQSSDINTPEGRAMNKAVYFDFFGRGRQVYPESVASPVPVYYQDSVYPASYDNTYSGGAVYSGGYYGRPVSPIDYSSSATYTRGHYYQPREHGYRPHVPSYV